MGDGRLLIIDLLLQFFHIVLTVRDLLFQNAQIHVGLTQIGYVLVILIDRAVVAPFIGLQLQLRHLFCLRKGIRVKPQQRLSLFHTVSGRHIHRADFHCHRCEIRLRLFTFDRAAGTQILLHVLHRGGYRTDHQAHILCRHRIDHYKEYDHQRHTAKDAAPYDLFLSCLLHRLLYLRFFLLFLPAFSGLRPAFRSDCHTVRRCFCFL